MKVSASTSIEDTAMERIRFVAAHIHSTESAIMRWCVMQGLPAVEKEVLGRATTMPAPAPEPESAAV